MQQVVKVAKIGKRGDSSNPNDYIFHSSYNTFKIIRENTVTVTLAASTNNQTFQVSHGLGFIPLPAAFAKESTVAQVFLPNTVNVNLWGAGLGWTSTGVKFNYIATDATYISFNFDNSSASAKTVSIRYFLLEQVN